MASGITTIPETFLIALPIFSWDSFIFSKISMELFLENEEKVVDEYLSNIKFTSFSRIKNFMLCNTGFHCLLYYRDDFHPGAITKLKKSVDG